MIRRNLNILLFIPIKKTIQDKMNGQFCEDEIGWGMRVMEELDEY